MILQMGIFTVVAQIGNTLLGNTTIKLERQIGTAGRVGVFAKFDENGNVRGGVDGLGMILVHMHMHL